jgi:DNA-binding NarL/FixJ family response regulator
MNDLVKAGLSPQQLRVAQGVLDGLSNIEIADRLGLTPGAVTKMVAHLCEQFEIESSSAGRDTARRIMLARQLMLA